MQLCLHVEPCRAMLGLKLLEYVADPSFDFVIEPITVAACYLWDFQDVYRGIADMGVHG